MNRMIAGAALAVALFGSTAFAATTTAAPSTPAATTAATPPASMHCTAPKVPTQVKKHSGKLVWKCRKPAL